MEWCDAFSLLLCKGLIQPEHRRIEISTGPKKQHSTVFQADEGVLSVEPWPFETDSFQVYFEKRLIPMLRFERSADLRSEFLRAKAEETTWEIRSKNR
jgi:hypothetical protein